MIKTQATQAVNAHLDIRMQKIIYLTLIVFGLWLTIEGNRGSLGGGTVFAFLGVLSFLIGLFGIAEYKSDSDALAITKEVESTKTSLLLIAIVGLIIVAFLVFVLWPSKCDYNVEFAASPNLEFNGGFNTTLQDGSTFGTNGDIIAQLQNPLNLHMEGLKVSMNDTRTKVSGQIFCRDIEFLKIFGNRY